MQPLVGPPEKFVELWAGVNLNSQAVWSSESSKELKQKYTVDRPNQTEEMQDVIVERALFIYSASPSSSPTYIASMSSFIGLVMVQCLVVHL